jgi:regulator of sirC expression with transglutaminase-like and TPR domain
VSEAHFDSFRSWMSKPEAEVTLDEACLQLSAYLQEPHQVSVVDELDKLDAMAVNLGAQTATGLMSGLFGKGRFRGNADDYGDPQNSYLDRVLERGLGIPISLAIVAIEVGRRIGVPLHGVGMPGHFLVGDPTDPDRFFDVFSGGLELDRAACRQLFAARYGSGQPFDEAWLEATGSFAVLARVTANLKATFARRSDRRMLAELMRLRVLVPGVPAAERLELADLLTSIGRFHHAAEQFEGIADVLEDSGDEAAEPRAEAMRAKALQSRARLN